MNETIPEASNYSEAAGHILQFVPGDVIETARHVLSEELPHDSAYAQHEIADKVLIALAERGYVISFPQPGNKTSHHDPIQVVVQMGCSCGAIFSRRPNRFQADEDFTNHLADCIRGTRSPSWVDKTEAKP